LTAILVGFAFGFIAGFTFCAWWVYRIVRTGERLDLQRRSEFSISERPASAAGQPPSRHAVGAPFESPTFATEWLLAELAQLDVTLRPLTPVRRRPGRWV